MIKLRLCISQREWNDFFTDHSKDKLLKELSKLGITGRTVTEIIRKPDELLYDS